MRVVLLTNFLPPYRIPLLEILSRRVELHILVNTAMEANRSWRVDWKDLDVSVQRTMTIPRTVRHSSGFSDRTYVHVPLDTRRRLAELRPEVIITSEMGPRTVAAMLYARSASCRLVVWATLSERTEESCSPARTVFRRLLLRCADSIIVNGESGKRYITSLGVPDFRVHKVPQVCDSLFLNIPGRHRSAVPSRLLFVGQLIERKGIVGFVEALDPHAVADMHLTVVGAGPLQSALSHAATRIGLNTLFTGHRDAAEVCRLYSESDYLVMPSLADEWGLVVNEAMSAGLPVLGSIYAQAVDELVHDGVTGWRFDPTDAQAIRSAVCKAVHLDPDQYEVMTQNCHSAARRATPAACAESLLNVLLC